MLKTTLNHRLDYNVPVKVERKIDLTREEIMQYLGQMTDGDGYIIANYVTRYNTYTVCPSIQDEIGVSTSTNKYSLIEMSQMLKKLNYNTGFIHQKGEGNDRDRWKLIIIGSREDKKRFLKELQPHLINKYRQAEALQQMYDNIDIEFNMELIQLLNRKGVNHNTTENQKIAIQKWKDKTIEGKNIQKKKPPTRIPNKICKKPAAVAGCMDSDGGISMIKDQDGDYTLLVTINTSVKEFYTYKIIDNLLDSDEYVYVNPLNCNERAKRLYPNRKPANWIRLSTNKKCIFILQFLYEVAPYMITRFEQAKTVIDYLEGRITAEKCYEILTDLNKRGKEAWNEVTLIEKIQTENTNINAENVNIENVNLKTDTAIVVNLADADNGQRKKRQNHKNKSPTYVLTNLDAYGLKVN